MMKLDYADLFSTTFFFPAARFARLETNVRPGLQWRWWLIVVLVYIVSWYLVSGSSSWQKGWPGVKGGEGSAGSHAHG